MMDRYWQTVRDEEVRMAINDERIDILNSPNKEQCQGAKDGLKHHPHWWNTLTGKMACMGLPEVTGMHGETTSVYEVDDKYVQRMYDLATWGQVRTPWDKLTENERKGFASGIRTAYREGFHAAMRNVADHVRTQQKDA